ncbi:hypothetical protein ACFHWS_11840, partial [Micromonospora sp. LOL_013]|uniref:hypothetical protein n=1 Tax=Micromonospora sp. LOL_013 TaxID=3345414 RepID=UPI003A84800C
SKFSTIWSRTQCRHDHLIPPSIATLSLMLISMLTIPTPARAEMSKQLQDEPSNYVIAVDVLPEESRKHHENSDTGTMGPSCTWPACGEVHNRSGQILRISRDSNSHTSCGAICPYGIIYDGEDSNGAPYYWEDVDCFAGYSCSVFYLGSFYDPGEYIRIWNPIWVYNVSC